MKIIGLDTNSLLDYRLKRTAGYKIIAKHFKECIKNKIRLYIPLPAFLETEWVLRSFYKQPKEKIVSFLEELLFLDDVLMDEKDDIAFSLNLYKENTAISLVDCLIVQQVRSKGYEFLTSDKILQKLYKALL